MASYVLVLNNTHLSASQNARVITFLQNQSNLITLHKEEPNKVIKAHKVEWVADKIRKVGTRVDIRIPNRWGSTDSHSPSKWAHINSLGITDKCTVARFRACLPLLRILIITETQSWLDTVLMANHKALFLQLPWDMA